MKIRHYPALGTTFSLLLAGGVMPFSPLARAQSQEAAEDSEILTRGPVHEAFAESISFKSEPGLIVSKQPPAPIEEMPPDQQLEGNNVTWIPGYWAWDDDAADFLWISGVWRNLPPGRQWVPGYWSQRPDERWQWTSGYWADASQSEVSYLPDPPATLEAGPNIEAPSDDYNWVPGSWIWSDARYAWRPGYWAPCRENWLWVPAHYRWTPRGSVFIDGYWDYAIGRRGVLFAPVRFRPGYYSRPGFVYSPSTVISLGVFSNHLFVRPNYGHYYFGDYYEPRYRDHYYASFNYGRDRRGYEPIFAYDRWQHRNDRGWEHRRVEDFDYFRDHQDARPPHTWAALRNLPEDRRNRRDDDRDGGARTAVIAATLAQFAGRERDIKGGPRFRELDRADRDKLVSRSREIQNFSRDRQQWEDRKDDGPREGGKRDIVRQKLERSPIFGRQPDQFAKDEAPPARLESRGPGGRNEGGARPLDRDGDGKPDRPTEPGRDTNGDGKPDGGAIPGRNPRVEGDRNGDGKPDRTMEPGRDTNGDGKPDGGAVPGRNPRVEGDRNGDGKPDRPTEPGRDTNGDGKPDGGAVPGRNPRVEGDRKGDGKPDRPTEPGRDTNGDGKPDGGANPGRNPRVEGDRNGDGKPDRTTQPTPERPTMPDRKTEPRPEGTRGGGGGGGESKPEREREVTPQPDRKTTPTPAPERPRREVSPQPERKPQPAPERKAQPAPEKREAPRREGSPQPERKAQPAPERKPQAQPQRQAPQAQPQRQAPQAQPQRQAPQAQPQRQAPQAQPQRQAPQAQPQRQAPQPSAAPKGGGGGGGGNGGGKEGREKGKGKDN